jgi:hypothetical protein
VIAVEFLTIADCKRSTPGALRPVMRGAIFAIGKGVVSVSVTGAIASLGLPVYITSSTYALGVASGAGIQRWAARWRRTVLALQLSVYVSPTTLWRLAPRLDCEPLRHL